MSISVTLVCDDLDSLDAWLDKLATAIHPVKESAGRASPVEVLVHAIKGVSLQELRETVEKRFEVEGYEVAFSLKNGDGDAGDEDAPSAVDTPPSPSPSLAGKKRGRPPSITPSAAKSALKGNGADPSAPANEPANDRQFVLDKLLELYNDPKTQGKVKDFTAKVKKAEGDTVSALPAEKFPDIRKKLEAEFAL